LNTLISLVILLNLVVALLGDTFSRVNEGARKIGIQEKARMMCENAFILNRWLIWRRAKYLIVIEQEAKSGQSGEWEGNINKLKSFLEETSNKHTIELKKIDAKLEDTLNENAENESRNLDAKI
jgi:hypothetical protein